MKIKILYTFVLLLSNLICFCQINFENSDNVNIFPQANINSIKILVDQDVFAYKLNEDRNYTMGLKFGFSSPKINDLFIFKPLFFHENLIHFFHKQRDEKYILLPSEINIFGSAFTPDKLGTQEIIYGDRPYSSLFGLETSIKYVTIDDKNKKYSTKQVSIAYGMLGLKFQGQLQDWIHKIQNPYYEDTISYINPIKPYGWNNQISNGGEPTFLFSQKKQFLLTKKLFIEYQKNNVNKFGYSDTGQKINWFNRFVELKSGYGTMFGYYNNFSADLSLRFGWINPSSWISDLKNNDQMNKATNDDKVVEKKRDKLVLVRKKELYFYANITSNFMLYNVLLHGQFLNSPYTMPYNDARRIFFESSFGIVHSNQNISLILNLLSIRTSEIKTEYARTHYWSGVQFFINFR